MTSQHHIPSPAEDPALYASHERLVLNASVALLVLPTVFVALRLTSRWMAGAGFWWDDLAVVLGMLFSWGCEIVNILASHTSLGHHIITLSMPAMISFFRHLYAFEVMYSLSMTFVKFSVLLFQYRIFPILTFRRILLFVGAFVIAFEIASTLVFIFQCVPVADFWIRLGGGLRGGSKCIQFKKYLLVQGAINTVTDLAILLLPLPLLWRLRASTLQKWVLIGIFFSGLVVTAVSMVRLVVLAHYHGKDATWDFLPSTIWMAAEPAIAVLSACLPSLRPLFVRLFPLTAPRHLPGTGEHFSSSSQNLASTWRSNSNTKPYDRSFNRLSDGGGRQNGGWDPDVRNNVSVFGGKAGVGEEVLEMDGREREEEEEVTPWNRIRAKTTVTVTVSERVEWLDDLF